MDATVEGLIEKLATDGYHAWDRQYTTLAGSLRGKVEVNGEPRRLSMGQLAARLEEPAREDRLAAFQAIEGAWRSVADLAAGALNSQAGFRLTWYDHRGWGSVLDEPLYLNRIQPETLDAMWVAVAEEAPRLLPYLNAKAGLIGVDSMSWYDVQAPVGADEGPLVFVEAAECIKDCFADFDTDLREFVDYAFLNRWVEASNRSGKAAGAFCTTLPSSKETRIFMTYAGTFGGATTLAHEFGHAYHAWLLRDHPYYATRYPMTLAETASTFCEGLLIGAALEKTVNPISRLRLIDRILEESVSMLMNLRSRFLFESEFYKTRAKGPLTALELDALMVSAQRRAYCGGLAEDGYHSLFWASKLHFYFTDVPFYNFPYVVGYLLASGLSARAAQKGSEFAADYRRLLLDTGVMTCEELAQCHLGVDLRQPDFWRGAIARPLSYVDEFVQLAGAQT
jgi:pepF/M3 family oligoendopeptidase